MSKSQEIVMSQNIENYIAGKQHYKCANMPNSKLYGIDNYRCLLWKASGDGSFDRAGYIIDHIIDYSLFSEFNISDLQALCPSCHNAKMIKLAMKDEMTKDGKIVIIENNKDVEIDKNEDNYDVLDEKYIVREKKKRTEEEQIAKKSAKNNTKTKNKRSGTLNKHKTLSESNVDSDNEK